MNNSSKKAGLKASLININNTKNRGTITRLLLIKYNSLNAAYYSFNATMRCLDASTLWMYQTEGPDGRSRCRAPTTEMLEDLRRDVPKKKERNGKIINIINN